MSCILAGTLRHISSPAVHMRDAALAVEVIPDTWLSVEGNSLSLFHAESRAHVVACSVLNHHPPAKYIILEMQGRD